MKLVIFIIIFGVLAIARTPILYPFTQGNPIVLEALTITTKVAFWLIPVVIFIKFIDKDSFAKVIGFTKFKAGVLAGLIIPVFQLGYLLTLTYILKLPGYSPKVPSVWGIISTIVFAALTEEIVFRGYLLHKGNQIMNFWVWNTILSILFALIHIPWWIRTGQPILFSTLATLFALSFLWGILKVKTKTIWAPVTSHALNNILTSIFV